MKSEKNVFPPPPKQTPWRRPWVGLLSIGLLSTLLLKKGLFCNLPTYQQSSMVVDIKLYHKTLFYYTEFFFFTWNKMTFIKWLFWYVLWMVLLLVHLCFTNATICSSYYGKWENIKAVGFSSLLCWYLNIVILSTTVHCRENRTRHVDKFLVHLLAEL